MKTISILLAVHVYVEFQLKDIISHTSFLIQRHWYLALKMHSETTSNYYSVCLGCLSSDTLFINNDLSKLLSLNAFPIL